MKLILPLLMCVMLLLAACKPIQAESPAETTSGTVTQTPIQKPSPTWTIAPSAEELPTNPGELVEFEPGILSTTLSDILVDGGNKDYVLSATAGQSLYIQVVGYDAPVEFTLSSPGGTTWSGESRAGDVYIIEVQVVLPEDGDYKVTLTVPSEQGSTRYDMTFSIDAVLLFNFSSPTDPPEPVIIDSGASSAQRSGLLPSGVSVKQYSLAATVGQTMTIDIISDGVPVNLFLDSPSGRRLFTEANQTYPTDGGYSASYSFSLFETGNYLVTLIKVEHTPSTDYTMDFGLR